MRINIIKGTAPLGLGYHPGETTDIEDAQALELIERGYATQAEEIKKAVEEPAEEIKKSVKKKSVKKK